MATYTTNLNLKKPNEAENFTVADANANSDLIDTAIGDMVPIAIEVTRISLGVDNVDNTSDTNKPVSTAQKNYSDFSKYMYGYFQKPTDFTPTLPCNFYRDSNNVMRHDMSFSSYKTGTKIYVDLVAGNDSTGNGTIGTPYKTIKKAADIAAAGGDASYCITVVNTTPFMRDEIIGTVTFTNKTIAIVHNVVGTRIVMSAGQRGLSWTADGAGTWKATRGGVYACYDFRVKDADGVYIPLTAKGSVALAQATANTWYTDNTTVWVHTPDGLIPTDSTIGVCVGAGLPVITLLGTSKLYMEYVDNLGLNYEDAGFKVSGDVSGATVVGEFVANNCTFSSRGRSTTVYGNAIDLINIKKVYMFSCSGGYATADIFNYHFTNVPVGNRRDCFVLEYNCIAKNAGIGKTTHINNATTCHEGVNILRIGCIGFNTEGPTMADVGGCYSIVVDCYMYDSLYAVNGTYYFDANSTVYVINSRTDEDAVGLKALGTCYVYKFTGNVANTGYQIIIG